MSFNSKKHNRSSTGGSDLSESEYPPLAKFQKGPNTPKFKANEDLLQTILSKVEGNNKYLKQQESTLADLTEKLNSATTVSSELDDRIRILEMTNANLISTVNILCHTVCDYQERFAELDEGISDIRFRSMKMNLIFYNVQQNPDRTSRYFEKLIEGVLQRDLKIPESMIYGPENLSGEIRVDIAHPIGQQGRGPRPIVVKFENRSSVELVFKFVHNLKGSRVNIARQLPKEMSLKRDTQYPSYKALKAAAENPKSVKLIQDKLYNANGLVNPKFSEKPLSTQPCQVFATPEIPPVPGDTIDGFQAHVLSADSLPLANDAIATITGCLTKGVTPYAYRVKDGDSVLSGHSDGGMFGASKELCGILEQAEIENALLVVHKPGDRMLGLNSRNNPSLLKAAKSALANSFLMDKAIQDTVG